MRWTGTAGTALLAEAAAHLLSIGWGFSVVIFAFVVVSMQVATTASKSAVNETRLNALVPKVGAAAATANAALPASGGTISGDLTVTGTVTCNKLLAGGASSSASVAGTTLHMSSTSGFDSSISASNFSGSYFGGQGAIPGAPIADGTPYENQVLHVINAIASEGHNAGTF
jgi:hypothetical protein